MKTTLTVLDIWVEGDRVLLRTDVNSVDIVLSVNQAVDLINALDKNLTEKYSFPQEIDFSKVKTFNSMFKTYFTELLLLTGNNLRKALRFAEISMETFKLLHKRIKKESNGNKV